MADKVAVIASEYDSVSQQLETIHADLLSLYRKILTDMSNSVNPFTGPLYAAQFSPKISSFVQAVRANVVSSMEKSFQVTEEAISDYEMMIMNIDVT